MTMKARWMAVPVFVVAAFAQPGLGVSAQEQSCQAMSQLDTAALTEPAAPPKFVPPIHDDWATARWSIKFAPPIHDDWAVRPR